MKHPRGREKQERGEHFTTMTRAMMETPAWRALSSAAQAIYPWLKLEWRGPNHNNNGRLSLSYRALCAKTGIASANTIARAFAELQAKGFIIVTATAHLGTDGTGRAHLYELTEHPAQGERGAGKQLYTQWREGADLPVQRANANNPTGRRESDIPSQKLQHPISNIETPEVEVSSKLRQGNSINETQRRVSG